MKRSVVFSKKVRLDPKFSLSSLKKNTDPLSKISRKPKEQPLATRKKHSHATKKNDPALRNRGRDHQSDSSRKIRSERSNLRGKYFSAGRLPGSMRSQPRSYRSREHQDLRLHSSSSPYRRGGSPREPQRY